VEILKTVVLTYEEAFDLACRWQADLLVKDPKNTLDVIRQGVMAAFLPVLKDKTRRGLADYVGEMDMTESLAKENQAHMVLVGIGDDDFVLTWHIGNLTPEEQQKRLGYTLSGSNVQASKKPVKLIMNGQSFKIRFDDDSFGVYTADEAVKIVGEKAVAEAGRDGYWKDVIQDPPRGLLRVRYNVSPNCYAQDTISIEEEGNCSSHFLKDAEPIFGKERFAKILAKAQKHPNEWVEEPILPVKTQVGLVEAVFALPGDGEKLYVIRNNNKATLTYQRTAFIKLIGEHGEELVRRLDAIPLRTWYEE
jgi:hypothetical protein